MSYSSLARQYFNHNLFRHIKQINNVGFLKSTTRTVKTYGSPGSNSDAYDGDGKTTVRVLNTEANDLHLINSYSIGGFRLNNGLFINGSMLLFPTQVYFWNVRKGLDITKESLIVFDLVVPKTKIVIIGYGLKDDEYDASIPLYLKKKGISCEMLPTSHAITTYNYLVADSVHVAGAFIPPKYGVRQTNRDTNALSADTWYEDDTYYDEGIKPREHNDYQKNYRQENLKLNDKNFKD